MPTEEVVDERILTATDVLPTDPDALLIGRVWSNEMGGPCPVVVRDAHVYDLSQVSSTVSGLLELEDIRFGDIGSLHALGPVDKFLNHGRNVGDAGRLLAPCDLQAIKAAGVTFATSMIERVIEERARGSSEQADSIRRELEPIIGANLRSVKPGSPEAQKVRDLLESRGMWSQYLEVGIGPYAEVFTKAQPMSSVGAGAQVGINRISDWNNPEPEIVLAVNSRGTICGATLGNDVNLRDIEGRSALLLGKAKDNNASCAIGPFIRLFDRHFDLADVESLTVTLRVTGRDQFRLDGENPMSEISRTPTDLVSQTLNGSHQYPDGFMLFLGTLFAPTQDRGVKGSGFTHHIGDEVSISSPKLGSLINWIYRSDEIAPWTFGTRKLFENLARRGLV